MILGCCEIVDDEKIDNVEAGRDEEALAEDLGWLRKGVAPERPGKLGVFSIWVGKSIPFGNDLE